MPTATKTTRTVKTRVSGYETRGCGECGGAGATMHCGNDPHDRPETVTCARCGGRGEASAFVYELSSSLARSAA
jgi:transcription elongation factor Elf1